jgi:uncharacterized protein (TIGR03067 family)
MRLLALFAAGLFAGTLVAEDKKDEKKPKDEEAILGTWKVEKMDTDGEVKRGAELVTKLRWTFKKDGKFILTDPDGKEMEATYKIDPTVKPRTIDMATGEEGKFTIGLYTLDGETLTLVMAPSGSKTRPTELKADAKAGTVVFIMKRVTDEKKDK